MNKAKMNFHKIYMIFISLVLLLISHCIHSQENKEFNLDDVKETIHIKTDRDLYFAGEEIFFSAEYFINQLKVTPVISNVIYVELINCLDNNSLIQKKYTLSDFNANGTISIPIDFATGNYMLRAYTQYQRNFSYLNYSYHFLTILNPGNNSNLLNIGQTTDSIRIVPEGNILLDNIKNNVVIQIPNPLLANENEYYITDESLNIIEKLEVSNKGFAQTEIRGNSSKSYNLQLIKSNGDSITTSFPKIQKAGIQTQTKLVEYSVNYLIQIKGIEQFSKDLNYQIEVFTNDFKLVYQNNISLTNSSFKIQIATEKFSDGINYIVLTDSKGNIEKINSVYIQSQKNIEIDIVTEKDQFKTRENVNAHIALKDNKILEFPIISVSVTSHGTKKEDHSFKTSLYLKNALLLQDYLMSNPEMDNNMRKQILVMFDGNFDENLFAEQIKNSGIHSLEYIPEIWDLTISGIIRNKTTRVPVANHNIYLSVLFNNPQLHICKSRENGEFIFSLNNIRGINDIFLCPQSLEEDENEILITNSFSGEIPTVGEIPTFIDSTNIELIRELYINAQIKQNFYIEQEKESQHRIQKHTFNIDNSSITTLLADFVTLKNMEELFTEIVPHVKFTKSKVKYSFTVFDTNGNVLSEEPLVLLDKIPVFDPTKIMQLDISQIEKVEVINKMYILGANTFHGVIMLTTNTNNFAGIEFPKSGIFIEYPTIEESDHTKGIFKNYFPAKERTPDFRTTLFWDTHIKLNTEGHDFNFITSDRKGIYDIVIKGYTAEGQIYFGRKQIFVQ